MGAGEYYLHDKDADTSSRVAFTHCENIPTQDPNKALKWMAWTAIHSEELKAESGAKNTGRPCEKPVFTLSLSWHPEQEPTKWQMVGAGRRALAALGLEEHETLMVAHDDRDHPHLHLIVNTVHPETGRVNNLSSSKLNLSKWAESYEREDGKIYCKQREENNARRDEGQKVKIHADLITELYNASDNGKSFQAALAERGFKLAQGRNKRILLIDAEGVTFNLSRRINGAKSKEIKEKLSDIQDQLSPLSAFADQLETRRKEKNSQAQEQGTEQQKNQQSEPVYFDRDGQDRKWQESIIDASINTPEGKRAAATEGTGKPVTPDAVNALQDRHLAQLGGLYEQNAQARFRLEARLEEQYSAHEDKLRSDIARLETVLSNSGRVRLWALKTIGKIPNNAEEDLQNMRLTLQNIEWRKAEARQAVESDVAELRRELEQRQAEERLELQPPPMRAHEHQNQELDPMEEHDSGPSLDY